MCITRTQFASGNASNLSITFVRISRRRSTRVLVRGHFSELHDFFIPDLNTRGVPDI